LAASKLEQAAGLRVGSVPALPCDRPPCLGSGCLHRVRSHRLPGIPATGSGLARFSRLANSAGIGEPTHGYGPGCNPGLNPDASLSSGHFHRLQTMQEVHRPLRLSGGGKDGATVSLQHVQP